MIDWGSIKFLVRFATHILLGSTLFALVGAVAIALHRLTGLMLDGVNTIEYITPAISGVEIFIFGAASGPKNRQLYEHGASDDEGVIY